MTVIKCKMCGANLNIAPDSNVYECGFCGTVQTVPTADDDKKIAMFQRANRLRFGCEFDKAASLYEAIIAEFPEEAESYWGLVLCKYGIEYVDDPATLKKIPTCHRTSFDNCFEDKNLELALEYADINARTVYREEAKAIENLRRSIIEISSREEPYDIFICYKETDRNGMRTVDSVIAQDVYNMLTENGYRVFFSRISLEDKIGQEYEPYIFASLNSAKIMLVFGTDYEHFNAVWVKNEWARFLHLIENGEKKTLIPCYKDIDAYDMPKEFNRLQAQDMGKIGAMQDLLRGINKILPIKKDEVKTNTAAPDSSSQADKLMTRIEMFLEDKDFDSANTYCDRILDNDPTNARAYALKLMAQLKVSKMPDLAGSERDLTEYPNFNRAVQFAEPLLKSKLLQYNEFVLGNITAKKQEADRKRQEAENLRRREEQRRQEEKRRIEEENLRKQQEEAARKRADEERRKNLICCDVQFSVKDSMNIFALANGSRYRFIVFCSGYPETTVDIIAGKGTVSKSIKLPEGEHNMQVYVFGTDFPNNKTPLHTYTTKLTVKKGVLTTVTANRPGLVGSLNITVS